MAKPTRIPAGLQQLPLSRSAAHVAQRVTAMEKLLERTFVIPGTKQPFGLDLLLNLLPVGGSFIGAALGSYMLWEARNLGMGKTAMARMGGNIALDWLFGLIPFVGAVPDFFFRSNTRNLRIIRKHLDRHHPSSVVIPG